MFQFVRTTLAVLCLSSCVVTTPISSSNVNIPDSTNILHRASSNKISPKVFIISMFDSEEEVWFGIPEFDLLAQNITVTGFSAQFPAVHCTADGSICQATTSMAEINAAVTTTALVLSPHFDLTSTYFLIAGIGGINPEVTTVCSVTFARYAVQVALQYEFDPRELPKNWSTGYVPQGSTTPDQYPGEIYGTEVYEVNDALRKLAVNFARTATLNDSAEAIAYRALYASSDGIYAAGTQLPSVVECDVATSDNYWSGKMLGESFSKFTRLVTNGTGVYCNTAQEDNATLEALIRAHAAGLVDFHRIIIMRSASDMDRPYPGQEATSNLWWENQGAFEPAVQNLYLAGVKIVEGILDGWNKTFANGVKAENYVGDILGTIGGAPDFGPGPMLAEASTKKRSLRSRR
ncbi:purine nucleoside permease-domain-containing protein [Phaeosphaeria sp. MPI-PUGE-AT-0046c]|nr:purine nucleoside permease-domain-containing protein [Phaeosphaeria sp. MPI-PUGE-AT-0046c]